jgi:hypothetical protein
VEARMFYVIDNGYTFSEHGFYFVKTEASRELVEAALAAKSSSLQFRKMFIASMAEEAPSGSPTLTLEQFCTAEDLVSQWAPGEKSWKKVPLHIVEGAERLPVAFLERVLEATRDPERKQVLREYIERRRAAGA